MNKKFFAFYDVILYSIIYSPPIILAIAILNINGSELESFQELIVSLCIAIPILCIPFAIQRIEIDFKSNHFSAYSFIACSSRNGDYKKNWEFPLTQVKNANLVTLTKEEKQKYTCSKFLFSKYLKIELLNGDTKYVYVSHYSRSQIDKMIDLLLYYNGKS